MATSVSMQTHRAGVPLFSTDILAEHADEVSFLWFLRDLAVHSPVYALDDLTALDDRVEAHLDGLRVAGDAGWATCAERLAQADGGDVFCAGVLALERHEREALDRVLALVEASSEAERGLVSALGWVRPQELKGVAKMLLDSGPPVLRRLGIAACAVHRVDPKAQLDKALTDDDAGLRARALRAAGELGRHDLLPALGEHGRDEDTACRFWAAWSAVLLGKRGVELEVLRAAAVGRGPFQARALQLALRATDSASAEAWLKGLTRDPARLRSVIIGTGILGGARYLPWLVKQMAVPEVARVAGEAFSMITGAELSAENLEGESLQDDEAATPAADEHLPWPNPDAAWTWLEANQARFEPGTRYFLGRPITLPHCRQVLATGLQRQREAAALELALSKPEAPLFETRAPGPRQRRLLAQQASTG